MSIFANSRWSRWFAILLFALLWFGTLGYRKLITPDEGRYAEIAREMLHSGDWLTPRLNGIKYFEKPALQYWATAGSFRLFGETDFAARLWPALTGFATLLVLFITLRRLYRHAPNRDAIAWGGAALLGSSAWWIGSGHFLTLDMGVSAFLAMALCAFLWAQQDDSTLRERRIAMLACWAALALATLSKGLIGLVIPGATLLIYTLWMRDWQIWRRLHWLAGMALFLVIAAPWFILASMRNPGFAHFFFIHEHFQRYATQEAQRIGPCYFFIPILLIGLLPWSALLPAICRHGWQKQPARQFQSQRFLLAWAGFVFVFFSISGSKLPAYILPMFPALAMLAAPLLPGMGKKTVWGIAGSLLLAGLAVLLAAPILASRTGAADIATIESRYAIWLYATGTILLLSAAATAWLQHRQQRGALIAVLALSGLITAQIPLLGHEEYASRKSSYQLASIVRPLLSAGSTVYSVQNYDQTLPFYLQRTVQLVDYQDEFQLGQQAEPDKLIDFNAFERRWRAETAPVAVLEQPAYERMQADDLPMRTLYRDEKRVVVTR